MYSCSSTCCLKNSFATRLDFSPVTLADKLWIDRLLKLSDSQHSAACFANILFWSKTFDYKAAAMGNYLILKLSYNGMPYYAYPMGAGDIAPVFAQLLSEASADGSPLRFLGLSEANKAELEAHFPGAFTFETDSAISDYIYTSEKLANLAGKKLSSKRNHINRFIEQNPDWSFAPITAENLPACREMLRKWLDAREDSAEFSDELSALSLAFSHFDTLGLAGGMLYAGGEVIAFTIGEVLNSNTYIVHFEKAFAHIQGAYPMINREFVRHVLSMHPHIEYINREEDMGIESLQKAKRSYYPDILAAKYTASWSAL